MSLFDHQFAGVVAGAHKVNAAMQGGDGHTPVGKWRRQHVCAGDVVDMHHGAIGYTDDVQVSVGSKHFETCGGSLFYSRCLVGSDGDGFEKERSRIVFVVFGTLVTIGAEFANGKCGRNHSNYIPMRDDRLV